MGCHGATDEPISIVHTNAHMLMIYVSDHVEKDKFLHIHNTM